jgi:flagellar hook-associated protein 2
MSGQVSFTGLNSNFDSAGLIQQLVSLETQSRIIPLEQKKLELQQESSFLNRVGTSLSGLSSTINYSSIIRGNTSLSPQSVTSSDTEDAFLKVTTTDIASPQSFDIEVSQLATETIRQSSSNLSLGIDTTSQLTDINLKGFNDISSGTVTINGETLEYTQAAKTILKTATPLTPPTDIDETTILNNANFKDGVSLSSGTLTINGDTKTFSLDTATATVQDLLDFLETFSGISEAVLANGKVQLTGISSLTAGTSNLVDALGFNADDITSNKLTGSHDITEHTLSDWGITGTNLAINGVTINFADTIGTDPDELTFDPNVETLKTLILAINQTSSSDTEDALNLKAAFDATENVFSLTNNIASSDAISVTSTDSNIVTALDLTDETLGSDNSLANVLTFLESFASVTSATLVNGKIQLDGSFTSLGSANNSSNMLKALGLTNAKIDTVTGRATGVQNLDAPEASTTLADLAVTGTTITINGEEITYADTDTIQEIVTKINNTANAKVSAVYDSLNGKVILTNEDTGALALTISSNGNIDSVFNLADASSEILGNNAEFTISTLNNGETLVSNSNSITGLIDGVTIDITKVTTESINIKIEEDYKGYEEKINEILDEMSKLTLDLRKQNDSFSRGLVSRFRNVISSIPGGDADTYKSFINIGLETELDADGNFVRYKLDTEKFSEAYAAAPDEVNRLLWGNSDDDSQYPLLESGNLGVFARLHEVLDSYTSITGGILKQVKESISSQIRTQDDRILRAEDSIQSMRDRLTKQFAQLDVITSQYQQQQAALASSGLLGG